MDITNNVSEFIEFGTTVVEDVFSIDEVNELRNQFHAQLLEYGINHSNVLDGTENFDNYAGPRIKSKAAHIFYSRWKLNAQLDERVYKISKDILVRTFGSSDGVVTNGSQTAKIDLFDHPFEPFDDVIPYIDRVCYRLPDSIKEEGGLDMHIDRNPTDPYLNGGLKRWRPIQGMITLTDHFGSECGGLKAVKGFHKQIDEYFKSRIQIQEQEVGKGEFCRLISKSHAALHKRLEPINAPKGSIIFFDNRLPHSTCAKLKGNDTREVIYFSYLPKIALNVNYCKKQLENMRLNIAPPMYLKDNREMCDKNWSEKT